MQVFIGTLPKGALVHRTHVAVTTPFNASTANQIDIGTTATPAALVANTSVTAGAIGTVDVQPATLAGLVAPTGEADLYVRYTQTGTAATAGTAYVVVEFSPDNDG